MIPFGSGKRIFATVLCEIQSARVPGFKTFVACNCICAYDAVVPKFAKSKLMVITTYEIVTEFTTSTLLHLYYIHNRYIITDFKEIRLPSSPVLQQLHSP